MVEGLGVAMFAVAVLMVVFGLVLPKHVERVSKQEESDQ